MLALSLLTPLPAAAAPAVPLKVSVYAGGFASVNSFIVSNGKTLTVIDVQRKAVEAEKLAALVRAAGLPLAYIVITHGHTDHFTGMAVFRRAFPKARIVVANAAIKRDIKAYAIYMDQGGATGAEPALDPALRPRSAAVPDGFDYESAITVLRHPWLDLPGGGRLSIATDYPPTEAPHMATYAAPAAHALFLSDLAYNRVHLWMGDDITLDRVRAWRGELVRLKRRYRGRRVTIYPGHGAPGGLDMLDRQIAYIDTYLAIVARAKSPAEAQDAMQARFPDYAEANFFLRYSVLNHVRPAAAGGAP